MTMRRSRLAHSASLRQHKRSKTDLHRLAERRLLLEHLEDRRLMAVGPRLTGIQPNNSDIFSFVDQTANVRDADPKQLTIRFDEDQQINPATLSAVRIARGGADGIPGNSPSDFIVPGFIGVGDSPRENEIVIRFAEALPDDVFQIEIIGAGSSTAPLRNLTGDAYIPTLNDGDGDPTKDTVRFELDLGAQVVAVVPQPVSRSPQGGLVQARNQIQVFFNNDDLLVGTNSLGQPLPQSAENPEFYQLIFTNDTVRNTDDVVILPTRVLYDAATNMATLTFAQDLDKLLHPDTQALVGPGTFRLRIGTDESAPLPPLSVSPTQEIATDFNTSDQVVVQFTAVRPGEQGLSVFVTRRDQLGPGAPLVHVVGSSVSIDLNSNLGNESTAQDVVNAVNQNPEARKLLVASISHGDPATKVGNRVIDFSPLTLEALGSSFASATNLTDDTDVGPVLTVTGSGFAFVDGDFFEITDTFNVRRKFEFDSNVPAIKNDPTAISINFDVNRSQSQMAQAIADAINSASFGVRATLAGNQIRFSGEANIDLSSGVQGLVKEFQNRYDLGQQLEVNASGTSFVEGQTFEVVDAAGVSRTFELDSGFVLHVVPPLGLQVPAAGAAAGGVTDSQSFSITDGTRTVRFEFDSNSTVTAGNVAINLTPGDSAETLGNAIADAIRQSAFRGELLGINPVHLGGGVLELRSSVAGANADITGSTLTRLSFNIATLDGQTFSINSVIFEYDGNNSFVDADADNAPDNVLITFNPATDNHLSIAAATAAAINGQVDAGQISNVRALNLGNGRLHLGGNTASTLTTSTASNLTQTGQPGATAGRTPVRFVPHGSFTANDVAASVAAGINAANAAGGFQATALAAGNRIRLNGDKFVRLPQGLNGISLTAQGHFDAGPVLVVTETGTGFGDGQTIRIRDDQGVIQVFEFDNNNSRLDPTATPIPFAANTTIATLTERIADAINSATFRVEATVVGDRVYLTNDRQVTLDPTLTGVTKTSQGIIISSSINPQPFNLDFPGGSDDPGHRDIPDEVGNGVEQHINTDFEANGRDATPGVTTILYNFRSDYGLDAQGLPLSNAITTQQKDRAREAFKLWSRYLGVQFIESAREGLTIATGDINALDTSFPDVLDFNANNFRVRVDPRFADGLLVMDNSFQWTDDFGQDWFLNAMVGVGSMLGLGLANDLPVSTLMARFTATSPFFNEPEPEPIFPGNADILHGQHLFRPDGVDVDLYRFAIDLDAGRTGVFTAETFAERLPNSSLLDTVLTVYRENPDGSRELLSRNDDYFSRDSFIELNLGPGVYYIGVSATGNNQFDPTLSDTGVGGRSQGAYDLRLNFRSQVEEENTIRDRDGTPTPLDGDADGVPGGVHNFWFQTRPLDRVLEVTGNGASFRDGQVVTITNAQGAVRRFEFDNNSSVAGGNTAVTFTGATMAAQMAQSLATAINGAAFSVNATVSGNRITFTGERSIVLSASFVGIEIEGKTIFVDKSADPNADGSLAKPFNNIARIGIPNAFSNSHPGDIIRIVGNGGSDGNLDTLQDNLAYEIGFGTLPGQILSDGTEMAVPQGVTVMIEPGTIFKMRRSRIGVGSSSLTVDRSGGALQVLGTPQRQVYFTSWLDETIGRDTHAPTTQPARGDWGGLVFRNDLDEAESRPNLENEGLFLNYVNHADMRYGGGGNVVIDSIQQVVQPIQMIRTRPTVTFNSITESADSAMSASPNSFDETNFHSPRFQFGGTFTSDYERIGPEIHSNRLVRNSTNGMFIRIETPAGNALESMTVSGRFDDTDVVHVLAENLVIQGSQSEPFLDLLRPPVDLVTFTPRTGGTLVTGTYNYKVTFVDSNGFEGRPSEPTANFTLTGANSAVQLNQLPPATEGFVRRRIYRTDDPAGRIYRLVAEINASDTVFVDNGTTLSTVLRRDPPPSQGITLTPQQRGSLEKGEYNYRIVFVDALGREGASSDATATISIAGATTQGGIRLDNLPAANGEFVARRIYRSTVGGISPYRLVTEIDATSTSYVDDGFTQGDALDPLALGVIRARPHARLAVDPGTVVKMEGARIEAEFGGQLIAEGRVGQEVVFTSRLDDEFGAGGTFDTNDDADQIINRATPSPGNWGGFFFGPLSKASIDNAFVAYGGGVTQIEGTFTGFNVIEVHQADLRLTHSIFENNAEGVGGQGPLDRFGRGYNRVATVFVRGAQPIIVDNIFRDNNVQYKAANDPNRTSTAFQMPVITINANSLNSDLLVDYGRSTGEVAAIGQYQDNRGPLIRDNRMSNNAINGLVVRGEVLTTQSVWDDSDIVHVLTNQFDQQDSRNGGRIWAFDEIVVPEHHSLGGLRLQSTPTESLVVKMLSVSRLLCDGRALPANFETPSGSQLNNSVNMVDNGRITNCNAYDGAGFTVQGRRMEIDDRIGGTMHVIGQPGFPVVITSLNDDTVGAGLQPDDRPQTDTNNNGIATVPRPNDWRSIRLDQDSNDRNVEIVMEMESADITAPGINATTNTAQVVGTLAPNEQTGDDNLRMGFEIQGFLNEPNDVDVYGITANAGTEIWVDIDRTTFSLDTVIELLDSNGNVLARSNDTIRESDEVEFVSGLIQPNLVHPLQKSPTPYYPTHASGLPKDYFSVNPRDAGMRIALPGNAGTASTYHLLVRSDKGLTSGAYQFQIRGRESDEFPGSTVRYADIRYANIGVELIGVPRHSPLLGEAGEDESSGAESRNDTTTIDLATPGNRPQYVGNLLTSDRGAISIAGNVSAPADVDLYRFDIDYDAISSTGLAHSAVVLDIDYADALVRFNSSIWVFDQVGRLIMVGRDSNIAEDRSGPLAGADLTDLSRGSVGPKDPFIGPTEFPAGRYMVAVTSDAQVPAEVTTNPLLRFEPVNSVLRIAEDHVERQGGSTADPPVLPVLMDPMNPGPAAGLWGTTTNRGGNAGHGLNTNLFDFSREPPGAVANVFTPEVEPNDGFGLGQNLDTGVWTVAQNTSIGDCSFNTSTSIPHISVRGTGNGTPDFYTFTVPPLPGRPLRGIFDIDFTNAALDTEMLLWDPNLDPVPINAPYETNDDLAFCGQTGSFRSTDSYFEVNFTTPGVYTLAVFRFDATQGPGSFSGPSLLPGDLYTLNISIENFPLGAGQVGNRSFYFGDQSTNSVPQNAQGSLLSRQFSLEGYSAGDLPTLYFNYFYQLANTDRFRVAVVDASGASTVIAASNPADQTDPSIVSIPATTFSQWRQMRLDLSRFAGQNNLRLRFDVIDNSGQITEGVYVDDLIIGFAERGEMITGATINDDFPPTVPSSNQVLSGNYQLEMRTATEFGHTVTNAAVGLVLDNTIDTNDRLAQKTTLFAPAGTGVVNGQTFQISDGVNVVTFEYEDPAIGDGVRAGNVEIRFKTFNAGLNAFVPDPDHVIARRIRDALNSAQVQQLLKVRAATSDGEASGTLSTDNRVNLFGSAIVDQPLDFAVTQTTTDGNVLRDTIVGAGITPVGNASFVGSDVSAAFFEGGSKVIGIDSGIVLTTGDTKFANKPNNDDTSSGRASQQGDAELNTAFTVTTTDSTVLEFDFQFGNGTIGGNLNLNLVFASEEYNEAVGAAFADAVAIFVDEFDDGVGTTNIALVPGGGGQPISTNTINSGQNPNLFRNNDPSDLGQFLDQFGYDGFTTKLVASALNLGPGRHHIKIVISDVGDLAGDSALFIETASMATTPLVSPPAGIESVRFDGKGDQNLQRDQGQVLVHSNTITDSKTFAIVADAGQRESSLTFPAYIDIYSRTTIAQPYEVRLQSPNPGPVRNLVVPNDTPAAGGFAPGASIVNNTISGDGVGGIHVSGDSRTFEIMPLRSAINSVAPFFDYNPDTAGDSVCDGSFFIITAYGRSVTFEFEDISGAGNNINTVCPIGGQVTGGNGWVDGRIPIFYRRTASPYTAEHPFIGQINRSIGYSQFEMAIAIKDAIDGSPLVSNDSTLTVHAYVAGARSAGGFIEQLDERDQFGNLIPGGDFAVYVEGVGTLVVPPQGILQGLHDWGPLSHAPGPQPFTRVVNNTIFGDDGNYSFFPDANVEPNDTLSVAIDTRQARQHAPDNYRSPATIGDTLDFRQDKSVDVDFYQFQLDIGDVATIDIDAITDGSTLTPVLRLFNSVGEELAISIGDRALNQDPLITHTALANDTYYVAVSGLGNETYSPLSLASRTEGASTGDYTIDVNVRAPQQFVIAAQTASTYQDGSTFQIQDVAGNVATFEFDFNNSVTANNVRIEMTAGFEPPEVAIQIASAISGAGPNRLNNAQNLPNGRFGAANPNERVFGEAFGSISQLRFAWNNTDADRFPITSSERFVLVRNAARLTDVNSGLDFTPNGNNVGDQLVPERGILVSDQATPTLLNNVLANLERGVQQGAFQVGSPGPADRGAAVPGGMVEGGSVYQNIPDPNPNDTANPNASNIPFSANDFNFLFSDTEPLFVNPQAGNFFPAPFSRIVDSAVDTLPERNEFRSIRQAIGLGDSPILSPARDASGQLRVDDPDVDSPFGTGADVFKDRGSLDRSDFVGPAAVLVNPQDNDADGFDEDPAVSTVQLSAGIVTDFTIQIVDGFESADPFPGVGVNDNTLDGRFVTIIEEGITLTLKGPAVTLFQDGVFLREGIDYTYRYDRTSNTIRLTPLSGVWPSGRVYVINVNNRDRFVIDATDGFSILDGDDFEITNDVGDTVTLEFDSGYTVEVAATLGVQLPLTGTGSGGIADGQRFRVDDGKRTVTFEFDSNSNVLPGNLPVTFVAGQTLDQLANSLVSALLQASNLNMIATLSPRNLGGGRVHLGATPAHRFDFVGTPLAPTVVQKPFSLVIPAGGGAAIVDNETFAISQGNNRVTFEFDRDGSGSTVVGSVVIPYLITDTPDILANLVANAFTSPIASVLNLIPVAVSGGVVELNASPTHLVDVTTSSLTRTMFVGGVRDSERFTISNGVVTRTFEFDNNGLFVDSNNDNVPDNSLITFTAFETHLDLADKMVTAINAANLGLTPIHVRDGIVNLGGTTVHTLVTDSALSLGVKGTPGVKASTTLQLPVSIALQVPANGAVGFTDGEKFSINDGLKTVIFEFDNNGQFEDANNDLQPDNVVIRAFGGEDQSQMAALVSSAIAGANLGLAPSVLGGGIVQLNSSANHSVNLFGSSMTRSDRLGLLADGETFRVDDGTRVITFEFEDIATNNGVQAGNTAILFAVGAPVDTVANAMAAALRGANLGLNPTNRGNGQVELGDTVRHLTDAALAPSLTLSGTPGGAEAIPYRLNFTEAETARTIVAAINSAVANNRIDNVSSSIRGGSTLFVDVHDGQGNPANFASGFAAISGISTFFLPAVEDLPGNTLKANQATNETQFTILLTGVQLDFGDIPDSIFGQGRYPTLFANNGARHVITAVPIFLGASVDADPDGQPNLAATGDDTDHLLDISGARLSIVGVAPFSIQIPLTGAAGIVDNSFFTIRRGTGPALRFEFDKNGSGLSAGSDEVITLIGNETPDDVADKIVAALNNRLSELVLRPANLGNGIVFVGGTLGAQGPSHTLDLSTSNLQFAATAPIDVLARAGNASLVVPARLQLQLPANGGAGLADGQFFTIDDTLHAAVRFEFDNNGSVNAGSRRITFSTLQSANVVADAMVTSIQQAINDGALSRLAPRNLGGGRVDLGGRAAHKLDASGSALTQFGPASNGQTFSISDGVHPNPVVFEFDTDANSVAAGNRRVGISASSSAQEIANAIIAAINAVPGTLLDPLNPVNTGEGFIVFNGPATVTVNANNSPELIGAVGAGLSLTVPPKLQLQVPAGGGGALVDGRTFVIDDTVHPPVRFEFDNNGSVANGNRRIAFSASQSQSVIADAVTAAIQLAVTDGILATLNARHLGAGRVDLGAQAAHRLDTTASGLTQFGPVENGDSIVVEDGVHPAITFEFDSDGSISVGATRIAFGLTSSANDIANAIVTALKNAVLANELVPLNPINLGDAVIDIDAPRGVTINTSNTSGLVAAGVSGGINDAQFFTVNNGSEVVRFEFDRNELSATTANSVRIGFSRNATRDQIAAALRDALNGTTLDLNATVQANGTVQLRGNDDDGVVFQGIFTPVVPSDPLRANLTTTIIVTASAPGLLDAWIDWNQDGDWEDPNEQVFNSQVLTTGANTLSVSVPPMFPAPSNLPLGDTYARFRFSSAGRLQPTGLAVDGEVEDYRIRVVSNELPEVVGVGIPDLPQPGNTLREGDPNTVIDASQFFDDIDITNGNGDFLTFRVVANDNPTLVNASFTDATTLTLAYQPDQNGFASITVRATDQGGLFVEQTFVVTVSPVNRKPTIDGTVPTPATGQPLQISEEQPIVITLIGNDRDPLPNENQVLTFTMCPAGPGNPTVGSVSAFTRLDNNRSQVTYTPPLNYFGPASFTVCTTDDNFFGAGTALTSDPFTVSLNVNAVNDAPVANSATFFGANAATEGVSKTIRITGSDVEATQLTFNVPATTVQGGTLTNPQRINANTFDFTYTPAPKFNSRVGNTLPDTFGFTVTDAEGATSATATVSIEVTPVNDPPEARNQSTDPPGSANPIRVVEGQTITITLDANDGDPEIFQPLTFQIIDGPDLGVLSAFTTTATTTTIQYKANASVQGQDIFEYVVVDSQGLQSPSAKVTVVVDSFNDPPTANATPSIDDPPPTEDVSFTFRLTGNTGDPESPAQRLSFNITRQGTNGTITQIGTINNTTALFRYTPTTPKFNGPESFVFTVTDDGSPAKTSSETTVNFAITAVNNPPTANPVPNQATDEQIPITITLVGDDGDPLSTPGDTQQITPVPTVLPQHGLLDPPVRVNATTWTITYRPETDYQGPDSFRFRFQDDGPGTPQSAEQTVSITVRPINDPPTFNLGPPVTANEDDPPQTIIGWATGITPGPVDENGQTVTFTVTNTNNALFSTAGQPTLSSSGTLTYTPAPNANGSAVVTIVARDNGSNTPPNVNTSAPKTFTITVNSLNDPPQFTKGADQTVTEDAGLQTRPWATGISPGPADEANQPLTFNVSVSTTGTLTFATPPTIDRVSGNLTFEAAPNTNGVATVTVTLRDNDPNSTPTVASSAPQTFTITVTALNDAPEFTITQNEITTSEDAGLVRVTGWAADVRPGPVGAADEAAQTLTFIPTVQSLQGGLSFATPPTINATTGELSFQTSPDKHGTAIVIVRLQDNGNGAAPHVNTSATKTFTITVAPVNDPPQFTLGADQRVLEDSGAQNVVGWATNVRPGPTTASDESTQSVSFNVTAANTALFLSQPALSPAGTLTYTPAVNAFGSTVVTVVGTDNGSPAGQTTRQFTITIDPVNDAPVVTVPNLQTVQEDTALAFGGSRAISVEDIDANRVEVRLQATGGTLTVKTNVAGGVTAADVLDNGTGNVVLMGSPAAINATLADATGLTYLGQLNFNGFDTLTVTANDLGNTGTPGPLSTTETVRISVIPVNDPPELANPIADLVLNEDSPNTLIELFPRVFNDPDVVSNNDQLSLRVVNNTGPNLVSATINGTVLNLALLSNQSGQSVITLEATDRSGLTVQDTFTLTVVPVNDPPTAINDTANVNVNTTVNINVLANDVDADSALNPASIQITSAPNNATVTVNSDGTIRFTPSPSFNGTSRFRYTVQDNLGAVSNEAEVLVTVNAAPTANNDTATTVQGNAVAIDVTANDTDSDGTINKATVVITVAPTSGTATVNTTTGVVTYTPSLTFSGTDSFRYTVRDNSGAASNVATVTITVTPTRFWQNSTNRFDVSNDGHVSPIDVLQIINRLNQAGPGPLPAPTPSFQPPPFYDVNGDGQLTSLDALQIINQINSGQGGEGEGESWIASAEQEETSSVQPFGILVAPNFSEFRYVPLASSDTDLLSSIARDDSKCGAGQSNVRKAVDMTVAEFVDGDDVMHSAKCHSDDLSLVGEDVASYLTTEGLESTPYSSAVDSVLSDLFSDSMEQ